MSMHLNLGTSKKQQESKTLFLWIKLSFKLLLVQSVPVLVEAKRHTHLFQLHVVGIFQSWLLHAQKIRLCFIRYKTVPLMMKVLKQLLLNYIKAHCLSNKIDDPVITMDNARIHHDRGLTMKLKENDLKILYLSLYSSF